MGMVMVYKHFQEDGETDWAGNYHLLKPEGWYLVARLKDDHPLLKDHHALVSRLGSGIKLVAGAKVATEAWGPEYAPAFARPTKTKSSSTLAHKSLTKDELEAWVRGMTRGLKGNTFKWDATGDDFGLEETNG